MTGATEREEVPQIGTPGVVVSTAGLGSITADVAVLFARADSHYKACAGVDVWDADRDARKWPGGARVVAHPPCRAWGALRFVAKPRADEKELARLAVAHVRRYAGVLEHPVASTLWKECGLAEPGTIDAAGGRCITVDQWHWGHKASKPTRLYFVGLRYDELPVQPRRAGAPTHCISQGHGVRIGHPRFLPRVTDAEREHTPPELAFWLVEMARRCQVRPNREFADAPCPITPITSPPKWTPR